MGDGPRRVRKEKWPAGVPRPVEACGFPGCTYSTRHPHILANHRRYRHVDPGKRHSFSSAQMAHANKITWSINQSAEHIFGNREQTFVFKTVFFISMSRFIGFVISLPCNHIRFFVLRIGSKPPPAVKRAREPCGFPGCSYSSPYKHVIVVHRTLHTGTRFFPRFSLYSKNLIHGILSINSPPVNHYDFK